MYVIFVALRLVSVFCCLERLWTVGVQFVRPDIGTGCQYWKTLNSVTVTCIFVIDVVTYCALSPLVQLGVSVCGVGCMIGR